MGMGNHTYFPPDIFYFVLWQDPCRATVSLELCEALMPSLSQGSQETPKGLIRSLKTWSLFELHEQRSKYCIMEE